MRSMLISSYPSPVAYVLSNYKTPCPDIILSPCKRSFLFKFDPLSPNDPIVISHTFQTTMIPFSNLGLVFGSL